MRFPLYLIFLYAMLYCGPAAAQNMGKKQAREIFEKAVVYLKVADEKNFIDLFSISTPSTSNLVPLTVPEIRDHYTDMRLFLDTALKNNIQIDEVFCEKLGAAEAKELGAKWKIGAMFRYSDVYRKGLSFYVDKESGKWKLRSAPDYVIENRK